jgi:hypothetical protein
MALGCAYRIQGVKMCAIVKVSDDQIRAAGHDPAIFMRHESSHCNGWGSLHLGAR